MKYVDLIIDNKSDQTDTFYTYGCSFEEIRVGQKVLVPLQEETSKRMPTYLP
jgi:primosomal protein N' (replication factor Y) (superfamily II helicase)